MVQILYGLAVVEGLLGAGFLIAAFVTEVPILAIVYLQIGAIGLVGAIFVAGFGRVIELLELILSSQRRSAEKPTSPKTIAEALATAKEIREDGERVRALDKIATAQTRAGDVAASSHISVDVEHPMNAELREDKECPKCAETIMRKAVVCRFCGYEYSEGEREEDEVKFEAALKAEAERKAEEEVRAQAGLIYRNIKINKTEDGKYEVLGKTYNQLSSARAYIDLAERRGMI